MLTVALAEHLALMATRAPSVHNSQPWRLLMTQEGCEVRADRSRELVVIDPLGRQLLASCGALTHHLVVSARAMGLEASVTVLPDRDDDDLVARVRLRLNHGAPAREEVARAEAILHRATDRRRFAETPVTTEAFQALRRSVEEQGASLVLVREDARVAVDVLVEHAEQDLLSSDAYLHELQSWVFDPARDGERADGIPLAAVEEGVGRAEEIRGRRFVPAGSEEQGPAPAEHPAVLLLTTPRDAPLDWVRSGMALSALLLEAAQKGLVAQPIGQVTDVAYERARLRQDLGLVGVPQLMLRLGRATAPGGLQTPRRPVDSVLVWADDTVLATP